MTFEHHSVPQAAIPELGIEQVFLPDQLHRIAVFLLPPSPLQLCCNMPANYSSGYRRRKKRFMLEKTEDNRLSL